MADRRTTGAAVGAIGPRTAGAVRSWLAYRGAIRPEIILFLGAGKGEHSRLRSTLGLTSRL